MELFGLKKGIIARARGWTIRRRFSDEILVGSPLIAIELTAIKKGQSVLVVRQVVRPEMATYQAVMTICRECEANLRRVIGEIEDLEASYRAASKDA